MAAGKPNTPAALEAMRRSAAAARAAKPAAKARREAAEAARIERCLALAARRRARRFTLTDEALPSAGVSHVYREGPR